MAAEPQRVLLKGADEHDLTRLDEYRAIGGYASLEKARIPVCPSEMRHRVRSTSSAVNA